MNYHVDAEHFPKFDMYGNGAGTPTWELVESFEATDEADAKVKFAAIQDVERYYKAKDSDGYEGDFEVTLYRLVQDSTGTKIEEGGGDVDVGAVDKTSGAGTVVDTPTCDPGYHYDETAKKCVVDTPPPFDFNQWLTDNWYIVLGLIIVVIMLIVFYYYKVM